MEQKTVTLDKIIEKVENHELSGAAAVIKFLFENSEECTKFTLNILDQLPPPLKSNTKYFTQILDLQIASDNAYAKFYSGKYDNLLEEIDEIKEIVGKKFDNLLLYRGLFCNDFLQELFYNSINDTFMNENEDFLAIKACNIFDALPANEIYESDFDDEDENEQKQEAKTDKKQNTEKKPKLEEQTEKTKTMKKYQSIHSVIKKLNSKIVGHNYAKQEIAKTIFSYSQGFKNSNLIGAFLLAGEKGVGKTELAKATADLFFNGNICIIRGGDYSSDISTTSLIGAGAGLVGYGEPNIISKSLKSWDGKPGVIVFDEFDQMHYTLFYWLYSILDEGKFNAVEKQGNSFSEKFNNVEVKLNNTIIFLTSNLGSNRAKSGFSIINNNSIDNNNEQIDLIRQEGISSKISPALFDRVKIIPVHKLSSDEKMEITKRLAKQTTLELQNQIKNNLATNQHNLENLEVKINFLSKTLDRFIRVSNGSIRGVKNLLLNSIKPQIISEFIEHKKDIKNNNYMGINFNIKPSETVNLENPFLVETTFIKKQTK